MESHKIFDSILEHEEKQTKEEKWKLTTEFGHRAKAFILQA